MPETNKDKLICQMKKLSFRNKFNNKVIWSQEETVYKWGLTKFKSRSKIHQGNRLNFQY